jgi:TP901 family phage tail tape measure protein
MAGSIKGIIVEIGGDTSGLQKAISKVNSATSSLTKELRGVNSLLKLDPKNTELLSQKQEILSEAIETTSEKLSQLKKIQEEANNDMSKVSPENYRNLQREIASTENKLKQLQLQASKWNEAGKKLEEFGNKFTNISSKIDSVGSKLTTSLTLPILAIGTAAVTTGNDFEKQMSRVQAISGATKDELEQLTNQAIDLGASTSFSASEVASGMENLASAGFTTSEIMEAMPGLLDLAASSGAELATASEIAASAIRGFGLEANESAHVADVFAEAAARTNAQTEDMGEAMKYVAPVAKTVGLSIEETAAAIGIMSDAGIKGSQAGTTLRSGLVRIVKPTKQVKEAMEQLNIEFYNSDGTMKSLTEIVEALQKSTAGLTDETKNQALAQIFGTEALSGMLALVNRGSDELSNMTKSFEDADGAASEMADTMLDNTAGALEILSGSLESAGIAIQKELSPYIKDLASWIQNLVDEFVNLSDEEKKNVIKTVALVAAIGPAVKIISKLGNGVGTVVKSIGTFSQAVGVLKTGVESTNNSANMLAKGIGAIASPMGIAVAAITTGVAAIIYQINKAEEETKNSLSNVGSGATDFVTGISSAKSHLDEFNTTLFASSEEQTKLEQNMQEVQNGITEICKTASNERRDYTQEEITQLDEYFAKLKELKDRELEIQKNISSAITQQAVQNAQSFQGNLEEYKVNSQEWIKTAQEQASKEIGIINERTTQEIALLQQRYGEKATLDNEAYANEYNRIMQQKNTAIQEANDEVAQVNAAYANGYLQRAQQNEGFYTKLQEYNSKVEEETNRHNGAIESFENNKLLTTSNKNQAISNENYRYKENMKDIWKDMYKNMSEEQEKELGTWLAMVAQTEMYGGEIDEETSNLVNQIIASYDSMPKETQEAMKNAMEPMLTEMQSKEPTLFAKAQGIADGILSRLKKSFDIHSPSRETRKIFKMVMLGSEKGLEDEEKNIYNQIDNMSEKIKSKLENINVKSKYAELFNAIQSKQGRIISRVADESKMIFTTPQIVFNVQELDEAKLEQCFNYINRKFGSKY